MNLKYIFNVFHTARHLKSKQIFYQIYYRVKKVFIKECRTAERRHWENEWSGNCYHELTTTDAYNFVFLGERGDLSGGWNNQKFSKLWLYNLHYLDNLNAFGYKEVGDTNRLLVNKWISDNPKMIGFGWEPYPISLRLVNIIKWASRESVHCDLISRSLVTQARALSQKVEYNVLGNHLLANGKGLVFCGAFIDGDEASRFLERGLEILDSELTEQFLSDGAHFELSPMYHSLMLWDLCDLMHLASITQLRSLKERIPLWESILAKGILWLRAMVHPDGDISFFNDSGFGIAPRLADIEGYAVKVSRLPEPSIPGIDFKGWGVIWNSSSGYVTIDRYEVGCRAILDLGKIGPDYQPGHAHADTLSFELSLYGERIIVNSGTSMYGGGAERLRQRSTSAHNTIEVDGFNSSEVWSGFRVARRAYPCEVHVSSDNQLDEAFVCASHDGYRRLRGDVTHCRKWWFTNQSIQLEDSLQGSFGTAKNRLYFHPDVNVVKVDDSSVNASLKNGKSVSISFVDHKLMWVENTTWHPEFGVSLSNFCVVVEAGVRDLKTLISWA